MPVFPVPATARSPSFSQTLHPSLRFSSGGVKTREFALCRFAEQIPESFVLNVENVVEARQGSDNVAVLLVEMCEGSIISEYIHSLAL